MSFEPDTPILQKEPEGGVPDVVNHSDDFDVALEVLAASQGPIAADAERASGFRYSHEDWLIQIKRGDSGIFLFDPIALRKEGVDFSIFTREFAGVPWILHDASQDLPGFAEIGIRPTALFDTEYAARLLNLPHVGLAAVTERFLGKTLAKEHSAADWSYRPLPRDWRNYAALDVELLAPLMAELQTALRNAGKDEWAEQEFAAILEKGLSSRTPSSEPWRHTSKITMLKSDRRALAIVRELWTVRDRHARELDIAPSLLLSDSSIIQAALRKPHNASQFRAIRGLNQRVRVYTGSEQDKMFERYAPLQRSVKPRVWKEAIDRAMALDDDELPQASPARVHDKNQAPRSMKYWREHQPERFARLQAAKKAILQIAEVTNVPSELVLTPKILRNLCWQESVPADVAGFLQEQGARPWQCRLVAESVSRVIM
ncbi:MAG: HRDC domain-containing protein [Bifidobacteriaceae bacterium]|nr:HRDC domain-containing protein [Bifidobacteriaceae bacterium]MCI1979512.1 HRDC domain-containing protein [Bifidobacteriaceae bacterium]